MYFIGSGCYLKSIRYDHHIRMNCFVDKLQVFPQFTHWKWFLADCNEIVFLIGLRSPPQCNFGI